MEVLLTNNVPGVGKGHTLDTPALLVRQWATFVRKRDTIVLSVSKNLLVV